MTRSVRVLSLALIAVFGASHVEGQSAAPPPPKPVPVAAPALLHPSSAPPPAAVAPRGVKAVSNAPPTFAPIRSVVRASATPPDSVRPKSTATIAAPPANAVAQCVDGSFVIAPNGPDACTAHRGVRVVFPVSKPPAAPLRVVAAPRIAAPAQAAAPIGATMRCKDGTYLTGAPAASRCAGFGGVAAFLAPPRPTPAQPLPRRP